MNPTQVSASSHQSTQSPDLFVSGVMEDQHTPLEEVFIFFDTATYDQIERDVKVNTIPRLIRTFAKKDNIYALGH